MAASEDEGTVEALSPQRADKCSANALASGALIGVRMTCTSSDRNTSSKPSANFASRSRIKKRNGTISDWLTRFRAC